MLDQLLRKLRHRHWPETTAEVQSRRSHALPEGLGNPPRYGFGFTYAVNGKQYDGSLTSGTEVKPGDTFPIRYNPAHPERNSSEPYAGWEKYYDGVLVLVLVEFIVWFFLTHAA